VKNVVIIYAKTDGNYSDVNIVGIITARDI